MKKGVIISICAVCVIVIALVAILGISSATEQKVARIGEYTITEQEFENYMLLSAVQNGSASTLEQVAQLYAKAQIATQEIAGTAYDISKDYEEELLTAETENFDRDYEANMAFCQENGISREQLIHATVTSKLNTFLEEKLFSKITEEYIKNEQENGKTYSADELLAVYESYMAAKLDALEFVPLDNKKLQSMASKYAGIPF